MSTILARNGETIEHSDQGILGFFNKHTWSYAGSFASAVRNIASQLRLSERDTRNAIRRARYITHDAHRKPSN